MKIILLTAVLSSLACARENKSRPVLEREKFVAVLTDVQLLEGSYLTRFQRVDSLRKSMDVYFTQIFEKHEVSRSDFEETLSWYALHATELEKVYSEVMDRLAMMSTGLEQSGQ